MDEAGSPICFNFNRMEVTFEREGKGITLVGSKEARVCKMIMGKRLQKMLKHKLTRVAQLFSIQTMEEEKDIREDGELLVAVNNRSQSEWEVNLLDLLHMLLFEYEDLFKEPTTLPPSRTHDHSINLKPNSEPFNARPYRYPPSPKNTNRTNGQRNVATIPNPT